MSGPAQPDFSWSEVRAALPEVLSRPLPAGKGQLRMSPRPRRGWRPDRVPADARLGAGLVLLFPRQAATHVVLTVRHAGLPYHPGQVSLPGGAVEPGETIEQAALREAAEEVALDPLTARPLGELSPLHIPVSHFALHPVVALCVEPPVFRAEPGEVERVLEPSLTALHVAVGVEERSFRGEPFLVPFFRVADQQVWGATAMVLAELFCALGRPPRPPWPQRVP